MSATAGLLAASVVCLSLSGVAWSQEHDRATAPPTSARAPAPDVRIDINHASEKELMNVPGMTRSWAGRIVRYRPYRTKQDLLDRGVLSNEVYDRVKDYLIAHRKKE